jgi:hypothetical protein
MLRFVTYVRVRQLPSPEAREACGASPGPSSSPGPGSWPGSQLAHRLLNRHEHMALANGFGKVRAKGLALGLLMRKPGDGDRDAFRLEIGDRLLEELRPRIVDVSVMPLADRMSPSSSRARGSIHPISFPSNGSPVSGSSQAVPSAFEGYRKLSNRIGIMRWQ